MDEILYTQMDQMELRHFWFLGRQEILKSVLRRNIVPTRNRAVRILDAGCGTGGNMTWLANYGEVWGIDNSEAACAFASKKHMGRIVQTELYEEIPFLSKAFDIVTMFDVLEHLEDDSTTLCRLRSVLRPDGKIVITVPAFLHLWSGHDVVHHHKRRYTINELRKVLQDSGFSIDYLSYFNSILYPVIATKRIIGKLTKSENSSDLEIPSDFINKTMFKLFSLEKLWIGRFSIPFGVSLVAVAHQKNN